MDNKAIRDICDISNEYLTPLFEDIKRKIVIIQNKIKKKYDDKYQLLLKGKNIKQDSPVIGSGIAFKAIVIKKGQQKEH